MQHYFKDKNAIVTGSAAGIGRALAVQLAQLGVRVAHCDVNDASDTTRAMRSHSAGHHVSLVDMGDKRAIDAFVDDVLQRFGTVDVLINNAGIALGDRTFEEVSEADFERITNINYWGVVHTTQRLYPHMVKRPQAAIANLSSSQGILAAPYLVPYCTTKFAVRGFTDALRAEHAVRGIHNLTFHTVHPGAVATNITRNADYQGPNSDHFHKALQTRGATPEKAADTILRGIANGTGRIFIADGRAQDLLARLVPTQVPRLLKLYMKLEGVTPR